MSTSKEDTNTTSDSPDTPEEAPMTSEETPTTSTASEADAATDGGEADGAFLSGTPASPAPAPALGGIFSAESFSALGLLLLAPVIVNTRLFDWFGSFGLTNARSVTVQEIAVVNAEITVAGGLSALAVLVAALSLFLGNAGTRAWARWAASATVLAGTLFVLISVVTFIGVPSAG